MRILSAFRRYAGLVCSLLAVLGLAVPASASHLRGGTISWKVTGTTSTSYTVQFTLTESSRWSYPYTAGSCNVATPPSYCAKVNASVNLASLTGGYFYFGDGANVNPTGTVTSINQAEDYLTANFVFSHTYSTSVASATAYFQSSARISTLKVGHDQIEYISTIVQNYANASPVAATPAILAVPLQNTATFNIATAVTDIDPNVNLVFRAATLAEVYGPGVTSVPCPSGVAYTSAVPPGFTVNAAGMVTWDTTQIATALSGGNCKFGTPAAGDLWTAQIMVETHNKTTNALVTKVPVDLLMKFVTQVGALPTVTLTPSGTQTVQIGDPVAFTATASSANAGAKVTLNASGVPQGATVTGLNATVTPPATSTFNWTPAAGQDGTYVVTYTVTDNNLQQATASQTIVVATLPTVTCQNSLTVTYGQSGTLTTQVYDVNQDPLNVEWFVDGVSAQLNSSVAAYPASNVQFTGTFGEGGTHTVKVTATDPHGVAVSCTTPVTVQPAAQDITFNPLPDVPFGTPDFALAATASSGLSVSYTGANACVVNGTVVHITGAGVCSITASQSGSADYSAATPVTRSFNVTPASQTITFSLLPSPIVYGSVTNLPLVVTGGGSINPVLFSVSGPAALSGNTLTITGAGTITVTASQAADANYTAATPVTQVVVVTPAAKAISFTALTSPVNVNDTATLAATTSNGDPVLYSVISGAATIDGNTLTYTNAGTVTVAADSPASANYTAAPTMTQTITVNAAPRAYVAPDTAVGSASSVLTATINIDATGTIGALNGLTQGAPGLDFKTTDGGTCVAGQLYTAGQACTVQYTFQPTSAGSRFGALTLTDASGKLLGASYVSGTGIGPLGLFTSTQQTLNIAGLNVPRGLSTDGFGNVYVLETHNGRVDVVAPGATAPRVIDTLPNTGSGGTAIDGAGNLYVNSTGDQTIYEYVGGKAPAIKIVTNTCGGDDNIETDGAGNLYFSCYTSNSGAIMKVDALTHAVTQLAAPAGHRFVAMTVDVAGNVFAPDFNTNTLYKLAAGTSTLVAVVSNDGHMNNPHGIALDPAGNIYVTNYSGSNRNINRYAAGTYAFSSLPAGGSRGVVIDGSGNLYSIPDDGSIAAFTRTIAPPISFPNTGVGTTSSSLQTVSYENDGNAPLTISGYSAATPFSVGSSANTCTTGNLAIGAGCTIGVTFEPSVVGAQTGSVLLVSNNANVVGTQQTVPLSGLAIKGSQAISFTHVASPVTYGVTPVALAATGGKSTSPVVFSVVSGPATVSGNTLVINGAGTVVVAANQAGDDNYNAAPQAKQTVVVNQAALTVAVVGTPSKTYDATNTAKLAAGNFQISGLVNGDNFTINQTAGTYASANAGAQPVTAALAPANFVASTGSLANYVLPTSASGPGQITQAVASVTPAAAGKVYGAADPALTGTLAGFIAADGITAAYTRTAGETVLGGSYTITATLSPASALSNYNITYNTAAFTITPAPLSVTANSATTTYGTAAAPFTGTVTGIVNNDAITATYTSSATATSPVGTYSIVPALNGAALSNYTVTVNNGTLTINPAPLNVTATNASRVYGAANPAFTGTVTGIMNNDAITATYTSSASVTSPVGPYSIVPALNGAALSNYTVTTNTGTLTVTAAPLTVTANNATTSYGTAAPAFTGTITGIVNNDAITATYTSSASVTSPVGPYSIVPALNGAALSNYSVTTNNGTLTITAAPLVVTPANATRPYGSANAAFTGTVTGIVNNDPITATYSTTAVQGSDVGTYSITAQLSDPSAKLANYTVTLNTGTLTIVKANQNVVWATPAAVTYATPLSAAQLNASVSVPGPSAAGAVTYSPAAGTVLDAGAQTLTVNVAGTSNYNAASATVTLTVNKAQPVFSALSTPTLTLHTGTATLTGTLAAPMAIPAGQQVTITLNNVTQTATVGANGSFTSTFNTASLPVAANGYTISYAFAGSQDFLPATASSKLTVAYAVCYGYDVTQVKNIGSTYPIKVSVCDVNGQNVATANTVLTGIGWGTTAPAYAPLPDAGNSNGNGTFRNTGGTFMWNLKTTGMPAGRFNVFFTISGDPTLHLAPFAVD